MQKANSCRLCLSVADAEKEIKAVSAESGLTVIRGIRGIGKSTVAARVFGENSLVSCRSLKIQNQILHDAEHFLKQYPVPLVLDDIDEETGLLPSVAKASAEAGKRMVVCGNPTEKDIIEAQQHIPVREIELLPVPDMSWQTGVPLHAAALAENAIRGSLPAARLPEHSSNEYWSGWASELLRKDIARQIRQTEGRHFYSFLRALGKRAGSELNMSTVAEETGVSSVTVKTWLALLENNHVIRLVPALQTSSRRPVKRPKLFFTDTALACYLTDLFSADLLTASGLWRGLALNALAASLRSHHAIHAGSESFYRDSNHVSVDWIQCSSDRTTLVNCAFSANEFQIKSRDLDTVATIHGKPATKILFDFSGSGDTSGRQDMTVIPVS